MSTVTGILRIEETCYLFGAWRQPSTCDIGLCHHAGHWASQQSSLCLVYTQFDNEEITHVIHISCHAMEMQLRMLKLEHLEFSFGRHI